MNRLDITLCLIVKNEQKYIESCINSCAKVCKDIIVVDTGSTDKTIEITRKYTQKIKSHPFNGDFSAARNAALEGVETEWVLFLDADERFENSEVEKLEQLLPDLDRNIWGLRVLRYNLFSTGGWYSGRAPKIFRNLPSIRYRDLVGETVLGAITDAGGLVTNIPVILNHFGYCRPAWQRIEKARKYRELMEREIQKNPKNAKMYAFVALLLRSRGDFQEAWEHIQRALHMEPESARIQTSFGHVLRSMGKYQEAVEAYKRAIQLNSSDSTAWNMLGVMYLSLLKFDEAKEAFYKTESIDPFLAHVLINQGLLEQAQGNYESAVHLFQEAAKRNPAFLHNEWGGYIEYDLFRELYYETIAKYAGLGYHLAYCQLQDKKFFSFAEQREAK